MSCLAFNGESLTIYGNFIFEMVLLVHAELMLLGFISLLLTVGQVPISRICVSEKIAATWHPCSNKEDPSSSDEEGGSQHETIGRRLLAAGGSDECAALVCLD